MESALLLTTVPASTESLLAGARAAGLDAVVPTCDGWHTHDLVAHVAGVFRWVVSVLETGGPTPRTELKRSPPGEAALDDLREACDEVVRAIEAVGPDGEAWNWARQPPVGAFWHRRMAHEAAVHAADAQIAAGNAPVIEPGLASDGIDELLTVIVATAARGGRSLERVGTLHVHCTDVEGEWLVVPSPEGATVTREHAKGDAALRGPASDLLLRLYNRGRGGEVIGDAGVLDRWSKAVTF